MATMSASRSMGARREGARTKTRTVIHGRRIPIPCARRRGIEARSGGENSNPGVSMDVRRANEVLGLTGEASSDELVRAHKEMLEKYAEDEIKTGEVEAAYDVLLMKSFNRRMKGEAANGDVKYADVVPAVDKIKASLPP
tara:strand:- start:45 stop:464 length:420 start_codon:yes stop_codon:yes gene_type:complete